MTTNRPHSPIPVAYATVLLLAHACVESLQLLRFAGAALARARVEGVTSVTLDATKPVDMVTALTLDGAAKLPTLVA